MVTGETSKAVILVVEDETIVALDMRLRLEKLNYRVCGVAGTAQAAIEKNRECQPDLVLMDIKLKGEQDGVSAAVQIQRETGTPVIFVTAFTDDATIARVREASPFGYIVKPFHEREVSIAIELALAKHAHQQSLERARALAEASNQAKTSFLSNISHELKTPLNSIIGFIDLALQLAQGDELQEYLLFAGRGARRLEASINAILDYTKLENNALAPVSSEFYIEDLLGRVWEPYAPDAYAKGLAIALYLDPALPETMHGDANKIATVLKNLLENAVKFTTKGYVRLSAERESLDGKDRMHVLISDSGTGISKEKLKNLFDPFSQGDASYTRLFEGLGLGLCLVKKLTDLMHIELRIDTNGASGTNVHLYLELPPGSKAAQAGASSDFSALRVGGFGLPAVLAADMQTTIQKLGAEFSVLDGKDPAGVKVDLLYIDLPAWSRADDRLKRELYGCVSCLSDHLIILGSPTDPYCYQRRSESYFRRPLPVMLSQLREDLLKCALSGTPHTTEQQAGASATVACEDPEPDQGDAEFDVSTQGSYPAFLKEAWREADQRSDHTERLDAWWDELRNAFHAEDFQLIERTTKRYYDEFSSNEQQAGARFALSLLMDVRKGPGAWIHAMQNLLHRNIAEIYKTMQDPARRL